MENGGGEGLQFWLSRNPKRGISGLTQGLAERGRLLPAYKSERSVSTAITEMAMPTFRSGVRTKLTLTCCHPDGSNKTIRAVVSVCSGRTVWPFTVTRHAG